MGQNDVGTSHNPYFYYLISVWLIIPKNSEINSILFLIPIVFFIDFICTYVSIPFVYSSFYIERFHFPNTHHIATNWNEWQSINIDEIVFEEDTDKGHRYFQQQYLLHIYRKKVIVYAVFIIFVCLFYFYKNRKDLKSSSSEFE